MVKKTMSVLFALVLLGTVANSANAQIFGKNEVESSDISDFKKWRAVLSRQEDSESENSESLNTWHAEIAEFKNLSDEEKIEKVNGYINKKIKYKTDKQTSGKSDYWASPAETFSTGFGDCEDYAIAKYFSLKALGFRENDMRIVVLRDNKKGEIHAVLAVNEGGNNYILDNQSKYVKQDTEIAYYTPIYSINSRNWWRNT